MIRITKLFFFQILILLSLAAVALAADSCHDYLGIKHQKYDCNALLSVYPAGDSFGAHISNDSGNSNACLERILREKSPKLVRLHLFNNPCVRGNYCARDSDSFGYTPAKVAAEISNPNSLLWEKLKLRIDYVKQLAVFYPNTEFLISPILENDFDTAKANSMCTIAKAYAPEFQIVDSAMKTRPAGVGCLLEKHRAAGGSEVVAPVTSHDGVPAQDTDIEKWKSLNANSILACEWQESYNCRNKPCKRGTGTGTRECVIDFVHPKERAFCPDRNQFAWGVRVMYPQPVTAGVPSGCRSVREPANGEIWKVTADDHRSFLPRHEKNTDWKANKVVFLSSKVTTRVENRRTVINPMLIRNANGAVIKSVPFYKTFGKKPFLLYRFYANMTSFELGQLAESTSGNEWIYLDVGNSECIRVNPYRRSGKFR